MAKKATPIKTFVVYSILHNNTCYYIGRSGNLMRRQHQHRKDYRDGKDKLLYNYLRSKGCKDTDITLIVLATFDNINESKLFEAYLILKDYFSDKKLKQHPPTINSYY